MIETTPAWVGSAFVFVLGGLIGFGISGVLHLHHTRKLLLIAVQQLTHKAAGLEEQSTRGDHE